MLPLPPAWSGFWSLELCCCEPLSVWSLPGNARKLTRSHLIRVALPAPVSVGAWDPVFLLSDVVYEHLLSSKCVQAVSWLGNAGVEAGLLPGSSSAGRRPHSKTI